MKHLCRCFLSLLLLLSVKSGAVRCQSVAYVETVIGDTSTVWVKSPYNGCEPISEIFKDLRSSFPFQWLISDTAPLCFAPKTIGVDTVAVSVTFNFQSGLTECTTLTTDETVIGTAVPDTTVRILPLGWQVDMWPNYHDQIWEGSSTLRFDNAVAFSSRFHDFSVQGYAPPGLTVQAFQNGVAVTEYTATPHENGLPLDLKFSLAGSATSTDRQYNGELQIHVTSNGVDAVQTVYPNFLLHQYARVSRLPDNSTDALHVYPNPVSSSMTIQFQLARRSMVMLDLFDGIGRRIETLLSQSLDAGTHDQTIDVKRLAAGIYMARLNTGDQIVTDRIVVAP